MNGDDSKERSLKWTATEAGLIIASILIATGGYRISFHIVGPETILKCQL